MFSKAFCLRLQLQGLDSSVIRNVSSLCKGKRVSCLVLERHQVREFSSQRGGGSDSSNNSLKVWKRENCKYENDVSTLKRTFYTTGLKQSFSRDQSENNQNVSHDAKETEKETIDISNLLETWFYEVSPYGSLSVQIPFDTVIRPLNPQSYPDMNKCIIQLFYNDQDKDSGGVSKSKLPDRHQLAQIADLYTLNVCFDKDKANMNLTCDAIEGLTPPVTCYIQVPLKYDVTVKMERNESITVENMEGNSIDIETDAGNVNLKKNKSISVSILSKSGDIVSKSTQLGNISMHCRNAGSITADKLQGSNVTCTTELGCLRVKSLYTESAIFKTVTGDIRLGHCHGQVCVAGEKSNVNIESLDGDLDAALQQGSVNVHLSRHNKVDVDLNTGDIGLSFPEGTKTNLNLSAASITIAENLPVRFDNSDVPYLKEGYIGEEGVAQVNARTMSGDIGLSMLDWIQTTKLAFMNRDE